MDSLDDDVCDLCLVFNLFWGLHLLDKFRLDADSDKETHYLHIYFYYALKGILFPLNP